MPPSIISLLREDMIRPLYPEATELELNRGAEFVFNLSAFPERYKGVITNAREMQDRLQREMFGEGNHDDKCVLTPEEAVDTFRFMVLTLEEDDGY